MAEQNIRDQVQNLITQANVTGSAAGDIVEHADEICRVHSTFAGLLLGGSYKIFLEARGEPASAPDYGAADVEFNRTILRTAFADEVRAAVEAGTLENQALLMLQVFGSYQSMIGFQGPFGIFGPEREGNDIEAISYVFARRLLPDFKLSFARGGDWPRLIMRDTVGEISIALGAFLTNMTVPQHLRDNPLMYHLIKVSAWAVMALYLTGILRAANLPGMLNQRASLVPLEQPAAELIPDLCAAYDKARARVVEIFGDDALKCDLMKE